MSVNERVDTRLRIYDGTADPNPFFVEGQFLDPITAWPVKAPSATQELVLDGGRPTANMVNVTSDESPTFAPIEVSFRFNLRAVALEFIRAWGNPLAETWTIGGHSWTPVLVSAIGTRRDSRGNNIPCAAPSIQDHIDNLVNVYVGSLVPPSANNAGSLFVMQGLGFAPTQLQFVEEGALAMIAVTGFIYGALGGLSDWPAGTPSIPT